MQALIEMSKILIASQAALPENPLRHLGLQGFSEKAFEGKQILTALVEANYTLIEKLSFSDLKEWYASDECLQLMVEFVTKQ